MDDSRHIENLIYSYAELIDNGDLEAVAELFRAAVIVAPAHNSQHTGYEQVLAMYRASCRVYEDNGTPLTKHLTSNVIIELADSGLEATARSYFTVIQATPVLPLQPIISGRYRDQFSKHSEGWQFTRREMWVDLVGPIAVKK